MNIRKQTQEILEEYYKEYKIFNEERLEYFLEQYYKNKDVDFETKKELWVELVKIGKL